VFLLMDICFISFWLLPVRKLFEPAINSSFIIWLVPLIFAYLQIENNIFQSSDYAYIYSRWKNAIFDRRFAIKAMQWDDLMAWLEWWMFVLALRLVGLHIGLLPRSCIPRSRCKISRWIDEVNVSHKIFAIPVHLPRITRTDYRSPCTQRKWCCTLFEGRAQNMQSRNYFRATW
jgi:hypothetical protein